MKKYTIIRTKLFIKIVELFKHDKLSYLPWYLIVIRFLIFPIEMTLFKIRSTGSFNINYIKNTITIFDEEINMKELFDWIYYRGNK